MQLAQIKNWVNDTPGLQNLAIIQVFIFLFLVGALSTLQDKVFDHEKVVLNEVTTLKIEINLLLNEEGLLELLFVVQFFYST